jgi:hypothetical protein
VDTSSYIALAGAMANWQHGSAQCLSGRGLTGYDFLSVSKEGFVPVYVNPASEARLWQCSVPMSMQKNVKWLWQHTEQYRSTTNDVCEAIEDFDEVEKIGQGFSSADPLEEIDIGDGITPMPIFVNKNMSLEHKDAIIKLIRDYVDYFA